MASPVHPTTIKGARPLKVRLGPQIVDLVTSGMYNNPLMVLREYVQNAVDAIEVAERKGVLERDTGTVTLTLNGRYRTIVIEDNGVGINASKVGKLLGSIGLSSKDGVNTRGFRGIGRLGGLGYAEELRFETRSTENEPVHVVSWNGARLKTFLQTTASHADVADAVKATVRMSHRDPTENDGTHFFRVTLQNIRQFHRDDLMNVARVTSYLQQVAPVPFADAFPLKKKIDDYVSKVSGYRTFTVRLNGRTLHRPHQTTFQSGTSKADRIRDVTTFEIPGPDGHSLGRGWYADTDCIAALPAKLTMRGIRVRQGNIEVGNEYYLADSFKERRFATWHIGELHLDYGLRANARRDGFEESAAHEAFLEFSTRLCRHLSATCRRSSLRRSQQKRLETALAQAEATAQHTLVINDDHRVNKQTQLRARIKDITTLAAECSSNGQFTERLQHLQQTVEQFATRSRSLTALLDGRTLRPGTRKELLERVVETILEHHDDPVAAEQIIDDVIRRLTKPPSSPRS